MGITIDEVVANRYQFSIQCFVSEIDESGKTNHICQIEGCANKYSSASAAIRHIREGHLDVYKAIAGNKPGPNESRIADKFFELRVKVNPEEIWDACVELVTVNALPLSAVEYPAFKKILHPYVIALKRQGIDLIVNRENIKRKIEEKAKLIRDKIVNEVKNKPISLMLDIASRFNRAVLGVNVAYFYDGKVRVRTIGMHVLRFSHTAKNLKELIVSNLNEFKIRLEQIIAITTDNGKNMLKSVAILNEDLQSQQQFDESDEFIDHDIFDEKYYDDLLLKVQSMFNEINNTRLIHGISCAAHCLHLVVTKAMENSPNTRSLVEKCRALAKKLRSPSVRSMLKSAGLNMAIIDVETRWNSIFSMVNIIKFELVYSLKSCIRNSH